MRTLNINKQKMFYALKTGTKPVYVLDDEGNPIIDYVDDEGNVYYRETGEYENTYSEPIEFLGNISFGGGETQPVEYGIPASEYEAVLVVSKNYIPLSETSLIWYSSAPQTDVEGMAIGSSADYSVIKISPSLNIDKYVLKRVEK